MVIKRFIILILILSIVLTGCYNYKDINRIIFVTMMVIDVNDDGEIEIYAEAFHSYRSNEQNTEQGQRLVYHAKGTSMFGTMRQLNVMSRYKLDYTQCKVYVFTEKAAEYGLGDFLDFLRRDQEFLLRAFLAVYLGPPKELLTADIKQDEFIGIYLNELFQDKLLSSILINYKFSDYLNARFTGKHVSKLNAIQMEFSEIDDFVAAKGVAVIKDDLLVALLDLNETVYCNFLIDRIKSGTIEVEHPQHKDKTVTLEIRKSKTKSDLHYDGRRILMTKTINIDAVVADAQQGLNWNEEVIEELEHLAAIKVKDETESLFARFKSEGIDLIDVQRDVQIKYPKSDIEDAIKITNLTSDVNVHILGSTYIRGTE